MATRRECGECQLCCKLLPIEARAQDRVAAVVDQMIDAGFARPRDFIGMRPDFDKPAGVPCKFQRHHKGCTIYRQRPFGCRTWNCRWLVENDMADMRRPDRCHYVIDLVPDVVKLEPHDGSEPMTIEVVCVWVDPRFRDARHDPALREYMLRRAQEGIATLIRFDNVQAVAVFPPPIMGDEWHEMADGRVMHRDGHDLNPENWTPGAGGSP